VAYLKKQLRPVSPPDDKRVQKLLGDLDNANFKVRSAAETEIASLGELALGELEAAFGRENPLEKQRRLEALLRRRGRPPSRTATAERLRQWRALEVLEKIGTAEARQLFARPGNGCPSRAPDRHCTFTLARLESLPKTQSESFCVCAQCNFVNRSRLSWRVTEQIHAPRLQPLQQPLRPEHLVRRARPGRSGSRHSASVTKRPRQRRQPLGQPPLGLSIRAGS